MKHEEDWFCLVADRLDYCPQTGLFTWNQCVSNSRRQGSNAGYLRPCGYICITSYGRKFLAHRLAFYIVHDRVPSMIDHINGIRNDNRICNLRECTMTQNQYNRNTGKNNKTGVLGVSPTKAGRYRAAIKVGGRIIWLGDFIDVAEAQAARVAAEVKYHGEFAQSVCRAGN